MERRVAEDIQKAVSLHYEIHKSGMEWGCFQVALQALGGNVHPQEVFNLTDTCVDVFEIMERKGLVIDWIIATEGDIEPIDLKEFLEIRLPEEEQKGKFRGYLCEIIPPSEEEVGHAFAILPSQLMPRDVRRRLNKNNELAVVDLVSEGGYAQASIEDLANYINNSYSQGRTFCIARVRQFKEVQI